MLGGVAAAAGVVESARLLLSSRSRWSRDGLGNDHDLVGRYFLAHTTVNWRFGPRTLAGLYPGTHRSYAFHDAFRRRGLGACRTQLAVPPAHEVVWKLQPEMEPRPENRITLPSTRTEADGVAIPDLALAFSERDRVVDRDNRVFALENLYVSGASTFPTSGTANPTLTVVALTLRLADQLVARASRAHG